MHTVSTSAVVVACCRKTGRVKALTLAVPYRKADMPAKDLMSHTEVQATPLLLIGMMHGQWLCRLEFVAKLSRAEGLPRYLVQACM